MPPDAIQEEKKRKPKGKLSLDPNKTIMPIGLATARVAQACDRCRAKKSKCDGERPACSACAAVGIKCVVSDKLSRRAFPKGYTETLEERIRQLEAENLKLQGLLDMRDEQLAMNSHIDSVSKVPLTNNEGPTLKTEDTDDLGPLSFLHTHRHGEGCSCCSNSNPLHEKPVSLAGSVYGESGDVSVPESVLSCDDDDTRSLLSLDDYLITSSHEPVLLNTSVFANREQSPAPGAFAAATAIEQMQKMGGSHDQAREEDENKQKLLTHLLAASIPRSTEETLFIPTLLARVCQVYGYNSRPAAITASAIASLKENSNFTLTGSPPSSNRNYSELLNIIMGLSRSFSLPHPAATRFLSLLEFPDRAYMDYLLTIYFKDWGNILPVVNKSVFLKNYVKLMDVLDSPHCVPKYEFSIELTERLGALMVLMLALALLSHKFNIMESKDPSAIASQLESLNHFDFLIHEFIKPNCVLTKYCSLQSLQILALALQYCLAVGDVTTCYELRGRVISMAQQLRLHRCPAAVLGLKGNDAKNIHLQNFMQGERRILFWCIYSLDAYASLNLGIPRLLKDFEIECAMPFSGKSDDREDEKDNENILIVNNTKLTIFGKVSKAALSMMQYCKVLGNIMDSVFTRSNDNDVRENALEKDRFLECWRRDLPNDLKFDIDVNGFSLRDHTNNKLNGGAEGTNWNSFNKQQLVMIFLYYHAKVLIYLPILSKYGHHHNVGMSAKEKLAQGQGDVASAISSMTMIQQSSIQLLTVMRGVFTLSGYLLPLPMNIPREQARFALLVAKGSLDYIKGGPLFQSLKQLLLDTVSGFKLETEKKIPGGLTVNSCRLIEMSIIGILGITPNKPGSSLRKRALSNQPIMKTAVQRDVFYNGSNSFEQRIPETERKLAIQGDDYQLELPVKGGNGNEFSALDMALATNGSSSNEESVEDILNFDPFNMTLGNQMMTSEFAADGSLGLVPFLNESYNEWLMKPNSDKTDGLDWFST